jgi:uncharacterized protein (UPF0333 family)
MRGAFFIVILITLLIVGVLVVKNMSSDTTEGVQKMETVQKAKDTAREVEEKAADLNNRLKDAAGTLPEND